MCIVINYLIGFCVDLYFWIIIYHSCIIVYQLRWKYSPFFNKAVGRKSIWGGGGLKNKSELLSLFSSFFVCFAYTNGNYCPPPPPPLPTAFYKHKIIYNNFISIKYLAISAYSILANLSQNQTHSGYLLMEELLEPIPTSHILNNSIGRERQIMKTCILL